MPTTTPADAQSVTLPNALAIYVETATTRNTNGNTATLTLPAGVSRAFVGVNLTVLTGGTTPSVQVAYQQLDANGNWQTIGNHTALTAVGLANFSVGPDHTNALPNNSAALVGPSFRLAWVITGAPTTATFQIGVTVR